MSERPHPMAPTGQTPTTDAEDTELLMTQHDDPTADPTAGPVDRASGWGAPVPGETTSIDTASTQAVPQPNPFRVEPATPVPDDVSSERETTDPAGSAPAASPGPTQEPHGSPASGASGCNRDHSWGHASHHAHVTVRKGPRPGAVVLGLLSMIVAAYVIAVNVSDADIEFRIVGPVLIGALGGLLLLVGLAGVVVGRLRR
jgi:hypothetical protein